MKILLVTTPQSSQSTDASSLVLLEPLALEYLGAGVQEHHDVKILDLRTDAEPGLKETLESFQPDILGCGAYTPEVYSAKKLCAEAKKVLPGILTIVGGQHATMMPGDFFEDYIDVVVIKEGVFPFKKICECHEKKKSFADIENIYYRKNAADSNMEFTFPKEHPPLDDLPFPARSLTSHIRHKYQSHILNKSLGVANVRGAAGCIYNCKFCSVTKLLDRKLYKHSIERIVEELKSLDEEIIFWLDDEFLLEPERVILLAKEIAKAGIKKYHVISSRADTIVKHPETIEEWAKIGLEVVYVGFDSNREEDLKKMRKGTTLSKSNECIRIIHENGVKVRGGFIVMPDYDADDFKQLGKYVKKLGVDIPVFSVWTPLPGTDLYKEEKDNLITHNYNFFDMAHTVLPTKLPLKKFYKEYTDLLFKKSMSLTKKIKLLKQLDPQVRKKMISVSKKMQQKVKNSYLDYN